MLNFLCQKTKLVKSVLAKHFILMFSLVIYFGRFVLFLHKLLNYECLKVK